MLLILFNESFVNHRHTEKHHKQKIELPKDTQAKIILQFVRTFTQANLVSPTVFQHILSFIFTFNFLSFLVHAILDLDLINSEKQEPVYRHQK